MANKSDSKAPVIAPISKRELDPSFGGLGKSVGIVIGILIIGAAAGNMLNLKEKLKSLSYLRFYTRSAGPNTSQTFRNSGGGGSAAEGSSFKSQTPPIPPSRYLNYSVAELLSTLDLHQHSESNLPSTKNLKRAYRQFALKNHPDKLRAVKDLSQPEVVEASNKFRQITVEYKRALADLDRIEKSSR
jgi:hypothetical protein